MRKHTENQNTYRPERSLQYYKTLLKIKEQVKDRTRNIPWLHRFLLDAYCQYRRWFARDIFHAIEIETTTVCNLRCNYCPVSFAPRGSYFMDEALFKKIIHDLAEVNYRGRIHPNWYGEPLVDKRLPDLIAYTKEYVPLAEVRIYTNGKLLTVELFNTLIEAGTDSFMITQHEEAMSENMKKVFTFVEHRPELREKMTYRTFQSDLILRNRGGLIVNPSTAGRRNKCKAIWQMDVNYKGEVALCCDDYFSSVVFGQAQYESVVQIWNKASYKKARAQLSKGIPVFDICKKCNMLG